MLTAIQTVFALPAVVWAAGRSVVMRPWGTVFPRLGGTANFFFRLFALPLATLPTADVRDVVLANIPRAKS